MNRSGVKDAAGAHLPYHFKVAANDSFVPQNTAHLLVAVDRDTAAVGGFERRGLSGQQASADHPGRGIGTE